MQVEYTTEMLSYADDTDYKLPSARLAFKWCKSMSDRDVRLVETQISHLMNGQAYKPRHTSLPPLSKLDRIRLTATSFPKKHLKRAAKYGVLNHFGDVAVRKAGLSKFEKYFRARLHATETKQLKKSWRDGDSYQRSAR